MNQGIVDLIHANPKDAMGYHLLADEQEAAGDTKSADALRFALHHYGSNGIAGSRWTHTDPLPRTPGIHARLPDGVHTHLTGLERAHEVQRHDRPDGSHSLSHTTLGSGMHIVAGDKYIHLPIDPHQIHDVSERLRDQYTAMRPVSGPESRMEAKRAGREAQWHERHQVLSQLAYNILTFYHPEHMAIPAAKKLQRMLTKGGAMIDRWPRGVVIPTKRGAPARLSRDAELPDGWLKPDGTYVPNAGKTRSHLQTAKEQGFPDVLAAYGAGWVHLSHIQARPQLIAAYHPTRQFTPEQLAVVREFGYQTGVEDISLDGGGTSKPLRLQRQGGYQSFAQALAQTKSPNTKAKLEAVKQLLLSAEEPGTPMNLIHHHPTIGFTSSVGAALTDTTGDIGSIAKYLSSWAGMITQKPAMTGFHVDDNGADKLHVISAPSLNTLTNALLTSGFRNFSVTPAAPYRAFVYDKGGMRDLSSIAGAVNGNVVSTRGTGHSVGNSEGSAADARSKYRQAIDAAGAATGAPAPQAPEGAAPARLAREGDPEMKRVAEGYAGKPLESDKSVIPMEESRRIAEVFAQLKHEPKNPQVIAAYNALKQETVKQYEALIRAGYKIEPTETPKYKNSREMIEDVRANKHLYYDPTHATGYDGDADHPMMEEYKPGVPYNDIFRAVHDAFGHAAHGHEFGRIGEHRAWQDHSKMFSPLAQEALTTETHGQNSWVNAGPHSHLPVTERPYGEQKAAVMRLKRGETARERRIIGGPGGHRPVREFAYGYLVGMAMASPPIRRDYPGMPQVHDIGGSIERMAPGALDHLTPHIARAFKEHRKAGGTNHFMAGHDAALASPHRMIDNGRGTTMNFPERLMRVPTGFSTHSRATELKEHVPPDWEEHFRRRDTRRLALGLLSSLHPHGKAVAERVLLSSGKWTDAPPQPQAVTPDGAGFILTHNDEGIRV